MSARSIGEIVANVKPQKAFRSGQPVWRNSYTEGQIEKRLWRPIADGTKRGAHRRIGAILKSARELERKTRRERQRTHPGCRNGVLGQIGLDVLEVLYLKFVDFKKGTLEPAISTIADTVGHSYAAVHAALRRLRTAGFLHWVRRIRPTERRGEAGPQVEQITNAYALLIPKSIEGLIKHLLGKAPIPDDARWRKEAQAAEWQSMLDSLSAQELQRDTWIGDNLAGETLARIARIVDQQRESSRA